MEASAREPANDLIPERRTPIREPARHFSSHIRLISIFTATKWSFPEFQNEILCVCLFGVVLNPHKIIICDGLQVLSAKKNHTSNIALSVLVSIVKPGKVYKTRTFPHLCVVINLITVYTRYLHCKKNIITIKLQT